jgi:hypothetical protein
MDWKAIVMICLIVICGQYPRGRAWLSAGGAVYGAHAL